LTKSATGFRHIRYLQENRTARSLVSLVQSSQGDLWVMKYQPKYLCDNEEYALRLLQPSGFVPRYFRGDSETLYTQYIENEKVTDRAWFTAGCAIFLTALTHYGIRHGDLTEQSVLVKDNDPVIIDWAESRLFDDPRPNKRREGDEYWLAKTLHKLIGEPIDTLEFAHGR
jgi:RIO-like serine/threonine protein kinase